MTAGSEISVELKHKLYERSVQNPDGDIDFINKEYRNIYGKKPLTLREDFGGTGYMACEWVKLGSEHRAWAIDLDNEPIKYGIENHYARLLEGEKERMKYLEANVMDDHNMRLDVVCAFNFSYYIFKKRSKLLEYFKSVRKSIAKEGMFVMDLFGGSECFTPQEEETEYEDFSYFWDLDKYNPLTNECLYYIHFETHEDGKRYEKAFTYDWRMWTAYELVEILEDAGFSTVKTYWEGEDEEDGTGDGEFFETTEVENCESWVSYIVAIP